jgi:hypothetical protein
MGRSKDLKTWGPATPSRRVRALREESNRSCGPANDCNILSINSIKGSDMLDQGGDIDALCK